MNLSPLFRLYGKMLSSVKRGWVAAILLVVTGLLTLAFPAQLHAEDKGEGPARVLYINSYHPGYKWSDDIENALMSTFNASSREIEVSIEYLDSRRFDVEMRIEQLAGVMKPKYADYPFDLVITSDNTAFEFAARYRERLFPGLPFVFSGYNLFRPNVLEGMVNVTGVNEEIDLTGTIEMALKIHPDARTLAFVISTGDVSSKRSTEIAESSVFPRYQDRFRLVLLKDASVAEIRNRLTALPKDTIVFISGQTSDRGDGRALTAVESSTLISAASPFPAYSFWDFNLGTGIVGGSILTGADQGRVAAELALKILAGARADDIPVVMTSPSSKIFDFNVMSRFGIGEERLPEGSIVLSHRQSVWDIYKWEITAAAIAVVVESILILALVMVVRQRNKALAALQREREMLEQRVSERTVELQASEEELRGSKAEAERANQAKSRFLSSMSHELRTPLNAVIGFSQFMQHNPKEPLTSKQKEYTNDIVASGEMLLELINGVLDLAKIEADQLHLAMEDVFASDVIDECITLVLPSAEKHDITITNRSPDQPPCLIHTDALRLKQVLLNFLSNAAKYNKPGGTVILDSNVTDDGYLRISVTDTGIGISPQHHADIFKPFDRLGIEDKRATEGTGIGLTVTKELTERMGGRIGFESIEYEGSTFWVEIPLVAKRAELLWNDKLSVGIQSVDGDHKILIGLLSELSDSNLGTNEVEAIIGNLINYTLYHFRREEGIMEACGYPHLDDHRRVHHHLATKVGQFAEKWRKDGDAEVIQELLEFLRTWLVDHIMQDDAEIEPFAKGKEAEIDQALAKISDTE